MGLPHMTHILNFSVKSSLTSLWPAGLDFMNSFTPCMKTTAAHARDVDIRAVPRVATGRLAESDPNWEPGSEAQNH